MPNYLPDQPEAYDYSDYDNAHLQRCRSHYSTPDYFYEAENFNHVDVAEDNANRIALEREISRRITGGTWQGKDDYRRHDIKSSESDNTL